MPIYVLRCVDRRHLCGNPLGIDYGDRHIGLALSSDDGRYVFTYQTLENKDKLDIFQKLSVICKNENVHTIVVGLPLDQNGLVGKEAKTVQQFAQEIKKYLDIAIEFEDERFSSAMASRLFREAGKKEREARATIDQKSAQLILQTYLDRKNAELSSH